MPSNEKPKNGIDRMKCRAAANLAELLGFQYVGYDVRKDDEAAAKREDGDDPTTWSAGRYYAYTGITNLLKIGAAAAVIGIAYLIVKMGG